MTAALQRCSGYSYTQDQILLSLKSVLQGSAGFRCLSNLFKVFGSALGWVTTPVHETIRLWLLKLGLFKLKRAKVRGDDWVYIVDISIQMGAQKCLLILGTRLSELTNDFCLSFEDVEPLVIKTVATCTGEVIQEALNEAIEMTGEPVAIHTDGGSELKRGIRLASEAGNSSVHINDVVHKIDAFLKRDLSKSDEWIEFKAMATASLQKLKLSALAHLAPPKQRQKARMLASFALIEWGRRFLNYVDSVFDSEISDDLKDKILWIRDYRQLLERWHALMCICKTTAEIARAEGYHNKIAENAIDAIPVRYFTDSYLCLFIEKIYGFLQSQGQLVPVDKSYPASTEVIESVFGKFKQLEQHHASCGLTSMVLGMPAVVGSMKKGDIIEAMENTSITDIKDWLAANLGVTYLSQRRNCLSPVAVCG